MSVCELHLTTLWQQDFIASRGYTGWGWGEGGHRGSVKKAKHQGGDVVVHGEAALKY